MIGKIVNNQIITPPTNDGNRFNVHLDADWLEANGYRELTQSEIDAANEAATITAKLARTTFTQLQIREAFKALGKEADLDVLLNGNAEFKTHWQEAQEIDLNHPVTIQALTNFTVAEIENLKMEM